MPYIKSHLLAFLKQSSLADHPIIQTVDNTVKLHCAHVIHVTHRHNDALVDAAQHITTAQLTGSIWTACRCQD